MAGALIEIDVYGAPRCSLCDVALGALAALEDELGLRVNKHDITRDPALEALYRREIPVIFVAGEKAYIYRVDAADLRARVARLRAAG